MRATRKPAAVEFADFRSADAEKAELCGARRPSNARARTRFDEHGVGAVQLDVDRQETAVAHLDAAAAADRRPGAL